MEEIKKLFTLEELFEVACVLVDGLRADDEESALEYIDDRLYFLNEKQRNSFGLPSRCETKLQDMVDEPQCQLREMYQNVIESEFVDGLYVDNIYTYESLKDILIEEIKQDHECAELFEDVQLRAEFYQFDSSMAYNGAAPIETKADMKNVLLYGYM